MNWDKVKFVILLAGPKANSCECECLLSHDEVNILVGVANMNMLLLYELAKIFQDFTPVALVPYIT